MEFTVKYFRIFYLLVVMIMWYVYYEITQLVDFNANNIVDQNHKTFVFKTK